MEYDMNARPERSTKSASAESQLKGFIDKFEPRHQTLIRAARKAMRRRLPTAFELAYDNYNFFVLGYGPTARPSDCIVSLAAGASGLNLCFLQGARLPDPKKVLLGAGNQTRFVRLSSAADMAHPEIETLLSAAMPRRKLRFHRARRARLSFAPCRRSKRSRRRDA